MEQQRISLTIPRDVREQIEAEQRAMSQRVGAELSFNQTATALLRRALGNANDFQTAPAG
ncbi:hypothetical protein DO71_1441 [Burkholderia pseudomallei]|uniref:hypothetical protein n=1 Tax=Burkholderia pseudomallei TaxID=28450 RepID=UPI00016A889B|nr:hypothetical protein [Burkholderia pseudomallei]AIV60555.1 hypothetical protein Y044_3081 [Burkholderia pseudomallei MSHR2243]KGC79186.1 hypothetical protein DO71_1441 [Burkholderia pseudomallei]KGV11404.1 hypothetical protein X891_624 [Burkholderia pseudomallei TSV 43]KGV41479.1 hypothetical protein X893_163 [Burkholderia pseudomallei TSV 31]MBM5647916.1 hypothetical protein [Burkholderia pseudomallei]